MNQRLLLLIGILFCSMQPLAAQDYLDIDGPTGPVMPEIPAWADPATTQITANRHGPSS